MKLTKIFLLFIITTTLLSAQDRPEPVYLCNLPNINDYNIFGNGGWDGNWYVGYNICWIKQLPPAPPGAYRKAFIGAKIGRAKARPVPGGKSWEKKVVKGDIYMALASTPNWSGTQRYFLVNTEDVPLEGDSENALDGVGESRWFWKEVPLMELNFDKPNFLALWSPDNYFNARDTSPVLCGGWGERGAQATTWLNDEIQGSTPVMAEKALKTPILAFEPAIAIKLIPEGTEQTIAVKITGVKEGRKGTMFKVVSAGIEGSQVERAWLEVSADNVTWTKNGRYLYNPPYIFNLNPASLPLGKVYARVSCEDSWSNQGSSQPFELYVDKN